MGIAGMSQTQIQLELNGRKITLVGTAHVSKESVEEVKETIKTLQPDCVAVELDENAPTLFKMQTDTASWTW